MDKHDGDAADGARGILAWLGRRIGAAEPPRDHHPDAERHVEQSAEDLRDRRRRQMLADMMSFLCSHRLEVNVRTLNFAHDVVTGADHKLIALIEQRVAQREAITAEWIEDLARGARRDDAAALLASIIARMQGTIDAFGETARAARSATGEYSSALRAQLDDLDKVEAAGTMLADLSDLARCMLERTRELEDAMEHSENRARALRVDLEVARREAACDPLTGLPNRRAFEAEFAREYAEAVATGEPLCVAFCDVDHFKRINDLHGHEAGDRVLREVAQTLSAISNDRCHVARHGGEEFVVLMSGRELDIAFRLLDGARQTLAARRLINRNSDRPFGRITFSAGIADVLAAAGPRDALHVADAALLRAKSEGRNRICLAAERGYGSAA